MCFVLSFQHSIRIYGVPKLRYFFISMQLFFLKPIIIYQRSIIFCLACNVIFTFQYTLRTVAHNFPTADHNLPYFPFFSKKCCLIFLPMWSIQSIVTYLTHQQWSFFAKKWKRIPDVLLAYVRQPFQDFIFWTKS